jgi:DNA-binding sugar fermentation-stimulating protein
MAFIVQREDVDRMKAAYSIDRKYTELIKEAHSAGVEIYVYQCRLNLTDISFGKRLLFDLE